MQEHEIKRRFLRRLYAKGALTMHDMYVVLAKEDEGGEYDYSLLEREAVIALFLESIVYDLSQHSSSTLPTPSTPLIPQRRLSPEQLRVLREWAIDYSSNWNCGHGEGKYAILDSIPWRFGPSWRKLYREI